MGGRLGGGSIFDFGVQKAISMQEHTHLERGVWVPKTLLKIRVYILVIAVGRCI